MLHRHHHQTTNIFLCYLSFSLETDRSSDGRIRLVTESWESLQEPKYQHHWFEQHLLCTPLGQDITLCFWNCTPPAPRPVYREIPRDVEFQITGFWISNPSKRKGSRFCSRLLWWRLFEDMERLEPVQTKVIVVSEDRQNAACSGFETVKETGQTDLDLFLKKLNVLHRL